MKRSLTTAAALACGLTLTAIPALAANASAASPATAAQSHASASVSHPKTPSAAARPLYTHVYSISTECATWAGELSWGSVGPPWGKAHIDVHGLLHDRCKSGYAQLFLHWDTVRNPKWELVKKVNAERAERTPYSTSDWLNNYKDIYLYVCENYQGYRCSRHYGPGA